MAVKINGTTKDLKAQSQTPLFFASLLQNTLPTWGSMAHKSISDQLKQ